MARSLSLAAAISATAVAPVGGLVPVTVPATAQAAGAPRTATVVGSLQSEIGCPGGLGARLRGHRADSQG